MILVKGTRAFRLELIVQSLEKRHHGTILEVDMNALRHNIACFRALLRPNTKIMAMMKACAYGSGNNFEIAAALQRHGIEYFGVAYIDEGIQLRKQGITLPIMVMFPSSDSFHTLLQYNLEPAISSVALLQELHHFVETQPTQTIPIHVKVDTGMHRLGIQSEEVETFVQLLKISLKQRW